MIYTGEITDAIYLSVKDEPPIKFIYGTVVYDLSKRFSKGDWIATSPLIKLKELDNGFAAITQNSIYFIKNFQTMDILWATVSNIRLGTPPAMAIKLIKGDLLEKCVFNTPDLKLLCELFGVVDKEIERILNLEMDDQFEKLIDIMKLAVDYFKTEGGAKLWFTTINRGLGGVTPFSLLNTVNGFQRVENCILKLTHGMTS